jgi:hypothetical protein
MTAYNEQYSDQMTNPVKGAGFDTPQMAGAIVIASLLALVAIRRGFRGVNVGGAGVRLG